jgi:hypothetical protein
LHQGDFKCQWLDKEELWERADNFRAEYWPEESLPVDIEQIVEFRLKIDIVPMHNLQSDNDMEACLKMDLSGIVVDYDRYMNTKYANRMRFSFAHELGHFVLHKDIYTDLDITSPEDWRHFILNVPENEYRNFEWQANEFAGRLLVPSDKLAAAIGEAYVTLKADKSLIAYLNKDPDAVLSRVSPQLCRIFGVSESVIEKRVEREKLWPPKTSISV